ncbi:hypothetical protein BC833DRAFT_529645, partial [Globomyces pollinis-pini]
LLFYLFFMLSAMSSKHQPNPRKRPYSEVDPPFPSLPRPYFKNVQEFAKESQKALVSVQQGHSAFPGNTSIFLPLISPHQLPYKFKVKESSVFVMVRKSYVVLKDDINSLNLEENCGLYVRGPVGVGKSYLLYLLAAEYRLNRQNYRVTYINDCAAWRSRRYLYFLKELVTTFYDDNIQGKSVVEWCKDVTGSEKEEKMMTLMMDALIYYVKNKQLTWLVICDQHNALYAHSVVVCQFPFNVIHALAQNRGNNIKVVISASANNEGYPTKMNGWYTHDISSHRFDDNEFKMWCDHYRLENIDNVDPESEEAVDAFFWTGGIPYELDLLWKQPKKTLLEKTILYRNKRVGEIAESHGKFCRKLSDEEKLNLKECISRMALGLSPPEGLEGMDRQIFDIIDDGNGHEIITALSPVGRDALITYYGRDLVTPLGLAAELVFQGGFTNDTKEIIIEKYIITMLEISKLFSFKPRKIKKNGCLSKKKGTAKYIEIAEVIHFSGNKLPLQNTFRTGSKTMFVPQSPNYPGFDFYIWDPVGGVLMGFQVAVKNPITKNLEKSGARMNQQMWLDFCGTTEPMDEYWIVPRTCIGKPTNLNRQVILLEKLHHEFPALKKLLIKDYESTQ